MAYPKTQAILQRVILYLITVVCISPISASVPKGFNISLAIDLSRLNASYTFLDLYDNDNEILPNGYEKFYTSDALAMDNMYQLYKHDSLIIINFRGSTSKFISWYTNLQMAMIPCEGEIVHMRTTYKYKFANDNNALVHSGYALSMVLIAKTLLPQIKNLIYEGHKNFIITGHSQGGALSNLAKAYFENLPKGTFPSRPNFTVYAFAAPMFGNQAFIDEYNSRYLATETSFNIVNPADMIPKMPLHMGDTSSLVAKVAENLVNQEPIDFKYLLMSELKRANQEFITQKVLSTSESLIKQISDDIGTVELPEFSTDINYKYVGNVVYLQPFEYPKILKDSTILQNDSLRTIYLNNIDDASYYKDGGRGFQHKPYNYYMGMLRQFSPAEYAITEPKVLPENL